MQNVMLVKQRLLVIVAALVMALAVSSSVAATADARINEYDPCKNPRIENPENCSAGLE